MKESEYFGVEIVGKVAYTEKLNYTPTVYGKQRNDFEGIREACLEFIESKGIIEVYGVLKDD